MQPAIAGHYLLFAAGEPDTGADGARLAASLPRMRAFHLFPPTPGSPSADPEASADGVPWHFPGAQGQCVRLVADCARRAGRAVTVIDVNHPGTYADTVARWVGEDASLPVLVAPDGRVLAGEESFLPSAVRAFVR